jgi:HEAT repeats
MKRCLFVLTLILALSTSVFAGVITKLDVSNVDDDSIQIPGPVVDGSKTGPIAIGAFASSFDRNVVRKGAGGFRNAMVKGETLAPELDLGEILAGALRAEGKTLGLNVVTQAEGAGSAWTVSGTIRDAIVDVQHMGFGTLLYYGYLDVDVDVAREGAAPVRIPVRSARMFVLFNGGMGIADESEHALKKLIVLGAQKIVARANREVFKAPALAAVEQKAAALKKVTDEETDLHMVGLAGSTAAVPPLVALLEKEKDENGRAAIVFALAGIGSAEVVPLLARRYDREDADVRYATVLAMDAAGTEEALALVREKGTKDKDPATKRLAERIVAARSR